MRSSFICSRTCATDVTACRCWRLVQIGARSLSSPLALRPVSARHRGKIAAVVCEKDSFRLVIDGDTIAEVPRTTSHEIGRYKAYATRSAKR
jgi:hypothetical protein